MDFRPAVMQDLAQLKAVYREIVRHMVQNKIPIWDEIYPCEFLAEDIRSNRSYCLFDQDTIAAAFALCDTNAGEKYVKWENSQCKALYLDRLGVNVNYLGTGLGSFMLGKAKALAKKSGAGYLRLFVVDINTPAIRLYQKNGFTQAPGCYEETFGDGFALHEYGFEAAL